MKKLNKAFAVTTVVVLDPLLCVPHNQAALKRLPRTVLTGLCGRPTSGPEAMHRRQATMSPTATGTDPAQESLHSARRIGSPSATVLPACR